jgi:DNA-binding response OmpR family regulator
LEDALRALEWAPETEPWLVISEVLLEDENILDSRLNLFQGLPLVIVAEDSTELTIAECLNRGAIDFFGKPIRSEEFSAKVNRLISKRKAEIEISVSGVHEISVCFKTFTLNRGKVSAGKLTAKEFQIFQVLDSSKKMVSRKEIQDLIWKNEAVSQKAFDVHLFNLRRKLETIKGQVVFSAPDLYRLFFREL